MLLETRIIGALVILSALTPTRADEPLSVRLVNETLLSSRLAAGLVPQNKREETIVDLFRQAGCQTELQRVDRKSDNVICTLPGASAEPIVVGGHFDFVKDGQGIVDDWSGAAMLSSLYEALKDQQRKHTFIFVAFAREEDGLVGSGEYVRSMDKDRRRAIRAFVNLECLGTGPTKVWVHRSTPDLVQSLAHIAAALKTTVSGVNVETVGDDDTHPFLDAKVPVISIHSLTQETFAYIHSKRDGMSVMQLSDYNESYRLIAFFLAYLDAGH